MFNKELKREIEQLSKEVEALQNQIWYMKYPYGLVDRVPCMFADDIIYKSSRNTYIVLTSGQRMYFKNYKIKKESNITYVIIDVHMLMFDKTETLTFAIQGESCIQINKPLQLDNFDVEKTIQP